MTADAERSKPEPAIFYSKVTPNHQARPPRTATETVVRRETEPNEFS